VSSPQEERDAALAAYKSACAEFDDAQEHWYPYLAMADVADTDAVAAEAAFDRLAKANNARQDALDTLWVAWRNRPDSSLSGLHSTPEDGASARAVYLDDRS
jgi:hypothetical protein